MSHFNAVREPASLSSLFHVCQPSLALALRDAYAASIHHTLGGCPDYLSMGVERDERCAMREMVGGAGGAGGARDEKERGAGGPRHERDVGKVTDAAVIAISSNQHIHG